MSCTEAVLLLLQNTIRRPSPNTKLPFGFSEADLKYKPQAGFNLFLMECPILLILEFLTLENK